MGGGNFKNKSFFDNIQPINTFIQSTNPNICRKYEKEGEGINEDEFSSLLKLNKGNDFSHGIFHIFENSNRKIPMKNFKGFYYMLKGKNEETKEYKKKFITKLLFSSKKEIPEYEYVENVVKYFEDPEQLKSLFAKKLKEKIKNPKNQQIYLQSEFMNNIDLINENMLNNIHVKEERNASLNNEEYNDDILYSCHCSEVKKIVIKEPEMEKKYNDSFSKMESKFIQIEKMSKTFTIKKLCGFLEEIGADKIIVKIISRYLSKRTGRTFLHFDVFKETFIKISKTKNEEEQIDLILSFLSFPNKDGDIEKETVTFLLKESNYEDNNNLDYNKTYKKEEFLFLLKNASEPKLIKLIDSIPISLDKISIIPFIKFDAIPFEPFHFKNIRNMLLKNSSIEQLMKDSIIKENQFCVINADFVQQMMNFIENSNSCNHVPIIDLTRLSDEKRCLKKNVKFSKDFFFCPKNIYDNYLKVWFPKRGNEIILDKIVYEPEGNYEEEEYGPNIVINKEGKIEEVEFYPITIKYLSFRDIFIAKSMKQEPIEHNGLFRLLEKFYNDKKCLPRQTLKFSRKTQLKKVFETVESRLDKTIYQKAKYHIYYNSRLSTDEINQNTTFEEQKIEDYCLVLINTLKAKEPLNISYLQEFQVELEVELPDSSINCYTEKSASFIGGASRRFSRISSLYVKRKTDPTILGFNNIGNSCYMNSILQILINMPYIKDIFYDGKIKFFVKRCGKNSNKGLLFDKFQGLMEKRYQTRAHQSKDNQHESTSINPKDFKEACGKINNVFANLDQQDANEFLYFVLNEFHEELNINYKQKENSLIENDDSKNNNNNLTEEDLSNLHWAKFIGEAPSFINSIFSMQLKSRLTCIHCKKSKISFENNRGIFLPIPLSKKIILNIIIQRLPYRFKIYYNKINDSFKQFCDLYPNNSTLLNLILFENVKDVEEKDSSMTNPTLVKIEMVFNKQATIGEMVELIRKYKPLELEPIEEKRIINSKHNEKGIEKREVIHYTSFIVGMIKGFNVSTMTILTYDMIIDECFQENQNVYLIEVLNSNGMNKIQGVLQDNIKYTLSNYILKNNNNEMFNDIIKDTFKKININQEDKEEEISTSNTNMSQEQKKLLSHDILTANNYLSYYNKATSIFDVVNRYHIEHIEYHIMINHCYQSPNENYYFDSFERKILFFPFDAIIVNNTENNFTALSLYDLIWNKYKRIIKEPSITENNLWWRNRDNLKVCYPFVIKICEDDDTHNYKCSKCPWYKFCKGCIVNPFENKAVKFDLNNIILVEWCNKIIEKEMMQSQINTFLELHMEDIDKPNLSPELPIDKLFDEFFQTETLDTEIECDNCKEKKIFEKNTEIDKLPPVLILTLKRFKYAKMFDKKIETLIKFPLINLKICDNFYDLYGVVNHLGSLSSGHYTATVNINHKWIAFDDSQFEEIFENQVVTKRAYILVYLLRKVHFNSIQTNVMIKENEEKELDKMDYQIRDSIFDDKSRDDNAKDKDSEIDKIDQIEIGKIKEEKSSSSKRRSISKYRSVGLYKGVENYFSIMKSLLNNIIIKEAENTLNTIGELKYYYPNIFIGEPVIVKNEKNEDVYGYIAKVENDKIEVVSNEERKFYASNEIQLAIVLTVTGVKKMMDLYNLKEEEDNDIQNHKIDKKEKNKNKKSLCSII